MEEEEYEFRFGFLLTEEYTNLLLEISSMAEEDPYDIILRAIKTLHRAHLHGRD